VRRHLGLPERFGVGAASILLGIGIWRFTEVIQNEGSRVPGSFRPLRSASALLPYGS
jgi:hypothetical protein